MRGFGTIVTLLAAILAPGQIFGQSPYRVEIDLEQQRAYLLQGRHIVLVSPVSSGRVGHLTEGGSFRVIEKERTHYSSIYGKIIDRNGNTVVADADVDMKVPRGDRFIPAPMHYFMRFHGADGMHAGYLPGYPASHGCVRMPEQYAIAFFNVLELGTPVRVFGRTPRGDDFFRRFPPFFGRPIEDPRVQPRREPYYQGRPYDPGIDPQFVDPWGR